MLGQIYNSVFTALMGSGLGRYDIQIATLSDTRFAEVWKIKDVGAGDAFFRSGRNGEKRREAEHKI